MHAGVKALLATLLLAALALQPIAAATTYVVAPTGKTNGTTPQRMGVSLGHAYVGSNW